LGAKLLLDLVEVFVYFGDGAGSQHGEAGQVSHVDDVDAASPALQQADRGVERPASGRRTVVPDHEVQEPRGRHSSGHGGTLLCCRGVSGQTLMRSFLAFLTGQPRVRAGEQVSSGLGDFAGG